MFHFMEKRREKRIIHYIEKRREQKTMKSP